MDSVTSLTERRERAERQLATFRDVKGGKEMNIFDWRRFRRLKREVHTVKELQAKVEDLRRIVEVWVANGVDP